MPNDSASPSETGARVFYGMKRHGDHQSVDRRSIRQSGAVPGAEYLLEVANVRKAFPGVLALDDVSFRLKRGHVHALMGENGAGKSTLMKIIAGIYTPDSGSFKLKGQEISSNPRSTRCATASP